MSEARIYRAPGFFGARIVRKMFCAKLAETEGFASSRQPSDIKRKFETGFFVVSRFVSPKTATKKPTV
jgi:hypothetical protein